jgi:hypothetical protein
MLITTVRFRPVEGHSIPDLFKLLIDLQVVLSLLVFVLLEFDETDEVLIKLLVLLLQVACLVISALDSVINTANEGQ